MLGLIFQHRMMLAAAAWGLNLWQEALLFGLISAASLPIGAYIGQRVSPVRDDVVAAFVAFGAGALLFAVTVELYGHALHEVAHGKMGYVELMTTIACALIGALMYLYLNKMMEEWSEEGDDEEPTAAQAGAGDSGASSSGGDAPPADARSRWARIKAHTEEMGAESRRKRGVMSAKDAVTKLLDDARAKKVEELKGRQKRMMIAAAATTPKAKKDSSGTLDREKTQEELDEEAEEEKRLAKGLKLAQSMFLGLLVDGVPESILLGFLAAERSLSLVLVVSLFIANFPEAFSSASLMKEAGVPVWKIIGMWTALAILTGVLACLACAGLLWVVGGTVQDGQLPFHVALGVAAVEGIAGGAMIACIAAVMLPEAFARKSHGYLFMDSGFLCTAGFLMAVLIKVTGGLVDSERVEQAPQEIEHKTKHGHLEHLAHGTPGVDPAVALAPAAAQALATWGYNSTERALANWGIHEVGDVHAALKQGSAFLAAAVDHVLKAPVH